MKPFVKWAGGKNQLLPILNTNMPTTYDCYIEPFVGGGALFFETRPQKAIINDSNSRLMNVYKCIRDCPTLLYDRLLDLETLYNSVSNKIERAAMYYSMRNKFNTDLEKTSIILTSAIFIFLNKTCYNGLYCINKDGHFTTPFANPLSISIANKNLLLSYSDVLKNTTLLNNDFEEVCKLAKVNDFVYLDPPYYNTFNAYQQGGFNEKDHIRLAQMFKTLTENGVKCMLSNSNTEFIKELYKEYHINVVNSKRMINCKGDGRTSTDLLISNYEGDI